MKKLGIIAILALLATSSTTWGQADGKRKGQKRGPGAGAPNLARMLQALDKNKDGKLAESEAPDRMKERFAQIDANKDGFVDADELKKAFARRMQRGGDAKNAKGSDQPRPQRGGGLDLARMFKEGDRDGDGNLSPQEQKAIIARFEEMMARFRQMRGDGNAKKKGGDRFERPNTDPVKPKRPGKE